MSRITDRTHMQYFGNGKNSFYLEFRCNLPCEKQVCLNCEEKSVACRLQTSRRFKHGLVTEPIPSDSHIYGGAWYAAGVKKWGEPMEAVIQFAEATQLEARMEEREETEKQEEQEQEQEEKKEPPKKRMVPKKPKVCEEDMPKKRMVPKKPKVCEEDMPKKRMVPKKPKVCEEDEPLELEPHLQHVEVTIPTHMEISLEELDITDYDIEYVKIIPFEFHDVKYYRDSKKNKLYKCGKDRSGKDAIGPYIGRYCQDTDEIVDIPDSDAE